MRLNILVGTLAAVSLAVSVGVLTAVFPDLPVVAAIALCSGVLLAVGLLLKSFFRKCSLP